MEKNFKISHELNFSKNIVDATLIDKTDVVIILPFSEFVFSPSKLDVKYARKIILLSRNRRVLNSKECCDNCIDNSVKSILEYRKELLEVQLDVPDLDGPLFSLVDSILGSVNQFLTYSENLDYRSDMYQYFNALMVLRSHILNCLKQISKIGRIEMDFGSWLDIKESWDSDIYEES